MKKQHIEDILGTPFRIRTKVQQAEAYLVPTRPDEHADPGVKYPTIAFADQCIALAKWCGGDSFMMADVPGAHILVPQGNAAPLKAQPGDMIVKDSTGAFHVTTPDALAECWEPASDGVLERHEQRELAGALSRAADQIEGLTRRNEVLSAQAAVVDVFRLALAHHYGNPNSCGVEALAGTDSLRRLAQRVEARAQ